jgi:hypothetical protein
MERKTITAQRSNLLNAPNIIFKHSSHAPSQIQNNEVSRYYQLTNYCHERESSTASTVRLASLNKTQLTENSFVLIVTVPRISYVVSTKNNKTKGRQSPLTTADHLCMKTKDEKGDESLCVSTPDSVAISTWDF